MDVFTKAISDLFTPEFYSFQSKVREFFSNLAADFREAFEFVVHMFA